MNLTVAKINATILNRGKGAPPKYHSMRRTDMGTSTINCGTMVPLKTGQDAPYGVVLHVVNLLVQLYANEEGRPLFLKLQSAINKNRKHPLQFREDECGMLNGLYLPNENHLARYVSEIIRAVTTRTGKQLYRFRHPLRRTENLRQLYQDIETVLRAHQRANRMGPMDL